MKNGHAAPVGAAWPWKAICFFSGKNRRSRGTEEAPCGGITRIRFEGWRLSRRIPHGEEVRQRPCLSY